MNGNYSQTVEVEVTKSSKTKQYVGIGLVLLSLGFVMLAIFVDWLFMIGFGLAFTLGMVFVQVYNSVAREFVYDVSTKRLVITKKTVINRYKRVLVVLHSDVENLTIMQGLIDEASIVACNASDMGVCELNFKEGDNTKRLLFAPDDYMLALMKEIYADKCQIDGITEY